MDLPESSSPKKYPGRPRRLPKLFEWVRPFYFITFNTAHRIPILARNEVHQTFILFCRRAEDFQIRVGEYVLMPDHIHALVTMPDVGGPTLSSWVGSLKNSLGKTLLTLRLNKPHWQEGFFDHVIRDEASQRDKEDYIRQNPVKAGLCEAPEKWPYRGTIVVL